MDIQLPPGVIVNLFIPYGERYLVSIYQYRITGTVSVYRYGISSYRPTFSSFFFYGYIFHYQYGIHLPVWYYFTDTVSSYRYGIQMPSGVLVNYFLLFINVTRHPFSGGIPATIHLPARYPFTGTAFGFRPASSYFFLYRVLNVTQYPINYRDSIHLPVCTIFDTPTSVLANLFPSYSECFLASMYRYTWYSSCSRFTTGVVDTIGQMFDSPYSSPVDDLDLPCRTDRSLICTSYLLIARIADWESHNPHHLLLRYITYFLGWFCTMRILHKIS